jgi:AhpD family alkylhydroperoxidase
MKTNIITTTAFGVALVIAMLTAPLHADEAPAFIQDTYPTQSVDAAWDDYQSVFLDPEGALDARTKELIALAVSAQVPCTYCIYYHTRAAQAHGADEAQIKEAIAVASLIRKWSTVLNGIQYDEARWHREVDAMFSAD